MYLIDLIRTDPRGGLHQRHHAAAPPQAPPGALVGVISALLFRRLKFTRAPLAPVAAEVEWNVDAALKSCSWTGAKPFGSTARMDDETRDQVVALLTRIGMMAEDLSVIALGATGVFGKELSRLIDEAQRRVSEIDMLSEQAASSAQSDYFES